MEGDTKMNKTILLVISVFAFIQSFLFSEEGTIRVTLEEGRLTLSDRTQISIGDSFESLESFSPRYLRRHSRSSKSYALTRSSSITVDIDYDHVTKIYTYLYSVDDDSWTEIEEIEVEGANGMIKVSRGMKGKELIDILEKLSLPYIRTYTKDVVVDLGNYYKVEFNFQFDFDIKPDDRELMHIVHWRTPIVFAD